MELQIIQKKIYEVRGHKVMLDFHLAELYSVETRALKQAVKRNPDRFPSDFMFILTDKELDLLVSQNVIPSKSYFGGALPYAFTEHGITMLSSVLKSKTAVNINIAIVRSFILLKQSHSDFKLLKEQIEKMESKFNKKFKDVHEAINYLLQKDKVIVKNPPRKKIGFKIKTGNEKSNNGGK
jgi:hypothetical protein